MKRTDTHRYHLHAGRWSHTAETLAAISAHYVGLFREHGHALPVGIVSCGETRLGHLRGGNGKIWCSTPESWEPDVAIAYEPPIDDGQFEREEKRERIAMLRAEADRLERSLAA